MLYQINKHKAECLMYVTYWYFIPEVKALIHSRLNNLKFLAKYKRRRSISGSSEDTKDSFIIWCKSLWKKKKRKEKESLFLLYPWWGAKGVSLFMNVHKTNILTSVNMPYCINPLTVITIDILCMIAVQGLIMTLN